MGSSKSTKSEGAKKSFFPHDDKKYGYPCSSIQRKKRSFLLVHLLHLSHPPYFNSIWGLRNLQNLKEQRSHFFLMMIRNAGALAHQSREKKILFAGSSSASFLSPIFQFNMGSSKSTKPEGAKKSFFPHDDKKYGCPCSSIQRKKDPFCWFIFCILLIPHISIQYGVFEIAKGLWI